MTSSSSRKQHYAALDGLRGIAAFSVLAYHLGHWLGAPWLAANGDLSVDVFFCLSGFVLAHAYAGKADRVSLDSFTAARLVRLMPLIVLATAISGAYVVIRAQLALPGSHVSQEHLAMGAAALAILLGVLNIPYFGAPASVGGPQVFPLNGPQYTLFFELFANLAWWAGRRLPQTATMVVVILISAPLVLLGGLGGTLPDDFLAGFPRVGLCFACGVLVYEIDKRLPVWRGWTAIFALLMLALVAVFYAPREISVGLRVGAVLTLVPVLLVAGARTQLPAPLHKAALWLGALSYPVYALHYPVFCWVNGAFRAVHGTPSLLIEGPLTGAAVIVLSLLALRLYDVPVRARLTQLLRSGRGTGVLARAEA